MEERLAKEIAKALEDTAKAWIGACVTNMDEYKHHHKKAMHDFMDYYRVLKPLLIVRDGWITSDDIHNEIEKYLHNNNEQELWDYWKGYYAN